MSVKMTAAPAITIQVCVMMACLFNATSRDGQFVGGVLGYSMLIIGVFAFLDIVYIVWMEIRTKFEHR